MVTLIRTSDIKEAKKQINNAKDNYIIVKAQDQSFNRKILEYGKFTLFLDVEKIKEKDSLRYINSGLNHVLARITLKNKISLGIDLSSIERKNKKDKAILLTKIRQNIKISRKTNLRIKTMNYKNKKDALSLLLSLGASTQQANEAL
ncbi:hypothetical protein HYW75_02485 [Candidatus Pacearchaeota archaeon]|nr:hypothetical protein [Candidatus Pacearchaeota archaeon]